MSDGCIDQQRQKTEAKYYRRELAGCGKGQSGWRVEVRMECANVCPSSQLGGPLVYTGCEWSRLGCCLGLVLDRLGRGLKRSQPMGRLTTGEHSHWVRARGGG
jgi:hypothetical protein